jgi:SAM-dependent methyltransferase
MSQALTDALVAAARVRPGLRVMDVASGAGEPALTLAAAVQPAGEVVATDLTPALLTMTKERAQRLGLTNLTVRQADAAALPFSESSFDLVTCRLGGFAEWPAVLGEVRRVLRPGGRIALVQWARPEESPVFAIMRDALLPHLEAARGSLGPATFAEPGSLATALREAGIREATEDRPTVPLPWPGTPEQGAVAIREMSPTMAAAWSQLTNAQREAAHETIVARLGEHFDGRQVSLVARVVVGTGIR